MRLIFAGTPGFAATALAALIEAQFEIALVLTRPDRGAGRGMKLRPSAVKELALKHRLRVLQPQTLKLPEVHPELFAAQADVMVVAAYGLILPPAVLSIPAHGCLNIHASLLPRWRGAAPIQRALLAGDRETGITIMQMDAGLDTGPMLLQEKTVISEQDTAQTLHDRLAQIGGRCIVRALRASPRPVAQDGAQATYAEKIAKAEAQIDWNRSAESIARQVRAFNPAPGAATLLEGTIVKIWSAHALPECSETPGRATAVGAEIMVGTGAGTLVIEELQLAGGKRQSSGAFLTGHVLQPGSRLGT